MRAFISKKTETEVSFRVQGIKEAVKFTSKKGEFSFDDGNIINCLLLTAYPIAMRKGLDLELDVEVDAHLVNHLLQVGEIWHQWRPDKFPRASKIIISDSNLIIRKSELIIDKTKAVMAFSGGVDSTYALMRNQENIFSSNVQTAVMIKGFGYNLEESSYFDTQFEKNTNLLKEFDINLTQVTTNYKKIVAWYPFFHGLGLAAVLNLFGKKYSVGYIGLDYTFHEETMLGAWGNLSILNKLYSSSSFEVEPIGYDKSRIEKVKYLYEKNALDHLAVCNTLEKHKGNCGQCDKCIRTMLMFRVNNIDYDMYFQSTLSIDSVKSLTIKKKTQYVFFKSLYDNMDINDEYREIIKLMLFRYTL